LRGKKGKKNSQKDQKNERIVKLPCVLACQHKENPRWRLSKWNAREIWASPPLERIQVVGDALMSLFRHLSSPPN